MRKLIIGVAAAIMAMAVPSIASADVRATVGAQYANEDFGHGDNADVWGLNGAFNSDMGGWTIQGDGSSNRVDFGGGAADAFGYASLSAGVRNDQWSAYGFVGLANTFDFSTSEIGIGGQYFLNNITLDASFTYADIDGAHSNPTDISVDGSYFFNDNFAVSARYSHIDTDGFFGGGNDNFNVYGVGAEYRFANSPVSLNVGYSHADTDPDNVETWTVGIKLDLGSDSLRDRSTHGPSWNGGGSLFNDIAGTF